MDGTDLTGRISDPWFNAAIEAHSWRNPDVAGPDLLPFRPYQRAHSHPLLRESAGIVPTGLAVQDGNYADINPKTGKRATIAELLKYATDDLKLDYIFWFTEEPYFSSEVVPFIKSAK